MIGGIGVKPGLEVLLGGREIKRLVGLKVGLIANHTSVTRKLEPSYLRLLRRGVIVRTIFTPEHGLWGAYQAGEPVGREGQPLRGVEVRSLYGGRTKPSSDTFGGLDLVVYDIQDVGCRTYTYISTMLNCLEAASKSGVEFMVLDRPNPLGGLLLEGPILKTGFESFVGPYYLPLRYGLTPAELSLLYTRERGMRKPIVIRMSGWRRTMFYEDTGMPWVYPSPAIPTPISAALYSGMCLLEATNLSEGRGTYKPFEIFGAPWLDSAKLVDVLRVQLGRGCRPMEVRFVPSLSKYKGELCRGVHLVVSDVKEVRAFEVAIHVLQAISEIHPKEFEVDHESMDRLLGDREVRELIFSKAPIAEIIARVRKEHRMFKTRVKEKLLYN